MKQHTFYTYDLSKDRFENSLNKIKNYLKDVYRIETKRKDFTITNDVTNDEGCLCVNVLLDTDTKFKKYHF